MSKKVVLKSATKFPEGTFFIRSKHNQELYLDAKGEGKSKGTPVIVWKHNGNKNQQWTLKKDHTAVDLSTNETIEYGTLTNVNNGYVCDIKGAKGPDIVCWPFEETVHQLFSWDGSHFIAKLDGRYLNIKDASTKKGALVYVTKKEEYSAAKSVEWELIPVPSAESSSSN